MCTNSWENSFFVPLVKRSTAPAAHKAPAAMAGKRLTGPGDVSAGAVLRFSRISDEKYDARCVDGEAVTFLQSHPFLQFAQVRCASGFTYWVKWEDLILESSTPTPTPDGIVFAAIDV